MKAVGLPILFGDISTILGTQKKTNIYNIFDFFDLRLSISICVVSRVQIKIKKIKIGLFYKHWYHYQRLKVKSLYRLQNVCF